MLSSISNDRKSLHSQKKFTLTIEMPSKYDTPKRDKQINTETSSVTVCLPLVRVCV